MRMYRLRSADPFNPPKRTVCDLGLLRTMSSSENPILSMQCRSARSQTLRATADEAI